MLRFVALQGTTRQVNESVTYRLHESVDLQELATRLSQAATTDEAVEVSAVFPDLLRPVALYIRPRAWGAWWLCELPESELNEVTAKKPGSQFVAQLVALATIAKQSSEGFES
jgi:hypothetical protein